MLSSRTDTILKYIVTQYITGAVPVPSQRISEGYDLRVSPATIRNEMALLEEGGYITRPHTSAGAIPTDRGYRYYVDSLRGIELPTAEQRLFSHLYHQVEKQLEEWLALTAALIARSAHNVAIVTMPKPARCRFKHMELVSLQDTMVLIVLVLLGLKIKKQLISFDQVVSQTDLTAITNKLNAAYSGLTRLQIQRKNTGQTPIEQQLTDCLGKMMGEDDELEYEEPYLDGWHFMFDQPEFVHSPRMMALLELVEQKRLLQAIIPPHRVTRGVQVIIGQENRAEVVREYSLVISQYGLSDEAIGTLGILGPTRMPYERAISTIGYLSSLLSVLVANLYGRDENSDQSASD